MRAPIFFKIATSWFYRFKIGKYNTIENEKQYRLNVISEKRYLQNKSFKSAIGMVPSYGNTVSH